MSYQHGILSPPGGRQPAAYPRADPYGARAAPVSLAGRAPLTATRAATAPYPAARDPYRERGAMPVSAAAATADRMMRDPYLLDSRGAGGGRSLATRDPYAAERSLPAAARDPYAAAAPRGQAADQYQHTPAQRPAQPLLAQSARAPPLRPPPERGPPARAPPARPQAMTKPAGNPRDAWQKEFEDMEADYFLSTGSLPPPRARSPVEAAPARRSLLPPPDRRGAAAAERYDPFENEPERERKPLMPPQSQSYPSRSTATNGSKRSDYQHQEEDIWKSEASGDRYNARDSHQSRFDQQSRGYPSQEPPQIKSIMKKRTAEENLMSAKKIALPEVGEFDYEELAEFKRWKDQQKAKQSAQTSSAQRLDEVDIWNSSRTRQEMEQKRREENSFNDKCQLCNVSGFRSVIEKSGHTISVEHCKKMLKEQGRIGLSEFKRTYPGCAFGRIVDRIIEKNPSEENMFIYRCGNVLDNHCKLCDARTLTPNSWFQHITGIKHAEKYVKYLESHHASLFTTDYPCLPKPSIEKMKIAKQRMAEASDIVRPSQPAMDNAGAKIQSIFQLAANMSSSSQPPQRSNYSSPGRVQASATMQRSLLPSPPQYKQQPQEKPGNEVNQLLGEIEKTKAKFKEELDRLSTQQQKLLMVNQQQSARHRSPSPPRRRHSPPNQRDRSRSPIVANPYHPANQGRTEASRPQQHQRNDSPRQQQRIEPLRQQPRMEPARPQPRMEPARPQPRMEPSRPQQRMEPARPQQRMEPARPQQRMEPARPQQRPEPPRMDPQRQPMRMDQGRMQQQRQQGPPVSAPGRGILGDPPGVQAPRAPPAPVRPQVPLPPQRRSRFDILPDNLARAPMMVQRPPLIPTSQGLLQTPSQQQLLLKQQQQQLLMQQQQQQGDMMGSGDVSIQQALEVFNATIHQFILLLSKNQGAANSMLDPATMGQLQAVMSELQNSGVGGRNHQQDVLQSQGQILSALSNIDPNVMQQLMATDPQLQGVNLQEMLSGLMKMQQDLVQQHQHMPKKGGDMMQQDLRRQHVDNIRDAHANRIREQQVREIQMRELQRRQGPRPPPPSLLTMRTEFRPEFRPPR